MAAGDRLEPRLERLDLARRLGVDLPQQRLAEVGQLRAGEAADESLDADDPELEPADLVHGVVALEHADAGVLEHRRRPRRSDSSGSRGCRAPRRRAARANGTRRRARPPAPARRASSGRPRAARRPPAPAAPRTRARSARAAAPRSACLQRRQHGSSSGHVHLSAAFTNGIRGIGRNHGLYTLRQLPRADRRDEASPQRRCATPTCRTSSAAGWPPGRAAGLRPSTTSTSSSARRTPSAHSRRSRPGRDEGRAPARGLAAEGLGRRDADRPDLPARPEAWIDDGYFERAEEIEVAAQRMPVASLADVLTTKLLALTEQEPGPLAVLELARSLREQIDWELVRDADGRTRRSRARSSPSSRSSASSKRPRSRRRTSARPPTRSAPRRGSCARRAARRPGGSAAGRPAGCA